MFNITAETLFIGKYLEEYASCSSTNELALTSWKDQPSIPEGAILITREQTKGRGQRGNYWEAEPGANLTFSLLLRPVFLELTSQFYLNIITSLAVSECYREILGPEVKIKWPNDIYYQHQKLSGILIESALSGNKINCSIVGVGMNINQTSFVYPLATSPAQVKKMPYDLNQLLNRFCLVFEKYYLWLRQGQRLALMDAYLERLYLKDERYWFEAKGEEWEGYIRGITESGFLQVEMGGQIREFTFKELVYKRLP